MKRMLKAFGYTIVILEVRLRAGGIAGVPPARRAQSLRVTPKAFGRGPQAAILVEACLFTLIMCVIVVISAGLAVLTLPASIFLGILALSIDELKKPEALVLQQSQEQSAVPSPVPSPVLTWNAPGTHQVRTKTVIDLNVGMFDLHAGVRTDVERSRYVPGQRTHPPTNTITHIIHD